MPTKAVSLNVDKSGSFAAQTVRISQGDENSTSIVATILDGAQPFDLTGKSVRFKCVLPGGKVFVDEGVTVSNAEKGMITFTPPAEVAAAAGKVTGALFEVYSDGYAIHTTKLEIDVDSTPTVVDGAVCELAMLNDYRSGEQAGWTHPTKNGMAFAGWYKDAELRYLCSASDTEGAAYAKFVKVADLIQFRGCSMDKSKNTPAGNTGLRFSYNVTAPKGSHFVGMGVHGCFASKTEDKTFNINADSLRTDGYADSNLVLRSMPVKYYEVPYLAKGFLKYATTDGTSVEVVEAEYHAGMMTDIADIMLAHPMATQADKDYAAAIKAAVPQEGAA